MQTKTQLLPISERRPGIKNLGISYIVCHDTGTAQANAQTEVDYYVTSDNQMQASAHYFVDDVAAIMCIPEEEKAWHVRYDAGIAPNVAGNFANDHALGIELCYFPSDAARSHAAYENYCNLIAQLCVKYSIPLTRLAQHAQLDPTRRTDPMNAFSRIGVTWAGFLSEVGYIISSINAPQAQTPAPVGTKKVMVPVKFVKFFNSSTKEVVTVFAAQNYNVQNDGQTFDFASGEEARQHSSEETFVFWDNEPVGLGVAPVATAQ